MQPKLELLTPDLISRILDEAFQLMMKPGIKVQDAAARDLLASAGSTLDGDIVRIPEKVVRKALESVPSTFYL
ncbi:MAG: trimethylamine methyltransferase family protein, partial [Kiritimatiellae bacterium]|nr:trimethylamine methyltransferase family protein [Kiritimatiellia bacterium]